MLTLATPESSIGHKTSLPWRPVTLGNVWKRRKVVPSGEYGVGIMWIGKPAVEQREGLRHELLTWSLARHSDRLARSVTAYQNISDEKVAGCWLLATPGSDLSIS